MRSALVIMIALCLGCASGSSTRNSTSERDAPPPEERTFNVELDEAKASELLVVLEQATSTSMLLDPKAHHALACTTVTLHLQRATARLLFERVRAALQLKGLLVDMMSHGKAFRVSLDPNVPEQRCPGEADPNASSSALDAGSPTPPDVAAITKEITKDIKTVSPNARTITKNARELLMEHFMTLFKDIRAIPEQENGAVVGIRLFGIRPDSVLGALGLENGDRLVTINGTSIIDPDQALQAYASSRNSKVIDIGLVRRGAKMHIIVRTVD